MKVIHFGCGALGRGLTMFSLVGSGCEVIAVDAYDPVVDAIRNNGNKYKLFVQDAAPENQHLEIQLAGILSLNRDLDEVKRLLREEVQVVTTSVIQENLKNVAEIIAEVWNVEDADKYMILLCENLENASDYFKNLLKQYSTSQQQIDNLMKIRIPNTMVDRGCGKNPKDLTEVLTGEFHEIAVDKRVVEDTGIALIPAVDNIDGVFARKRFLLNTFADASAFEGIMHGHNSFVTATLDPEVRACVLPYMELIKKGLLLGFGLSQEEIDYWFEKYKGRVNYDMPAKSPTTSVKEDTQRDLDNVARNMMRKLGRGERFVTPILVIIEKAPETDLTPAYTIISRIVQHEKDKNGYTLEETQAKLREMWCTDPAGEKLFEEISKLVR